MRTRGAGSTWNISDQNSRERAPVSHNQERASTACRSFVACRASTAFRASIASEQSVSRAVYSEITHCVWHVSYAAAKNVYGKCGKYGKYRVGQMENVRNVCKVRQD